MRKVLVMILIVWIGLVGCAYQSTPMTSATETPTKVTAGTPIGTVSLIAHVQAAKPTLVMPSGNLNSTPAAGKSNFLPLVSTISTLPPTQAAFSFISWGDAQDDGAHLPATSNQAAILNPTFTIFNGDLEDNGFNLTQMNVEISALNGGGSQPNGIFNKTFLVRGNHDNFKLGSAGQWENYFTSANRPLLPGVTHYVAIDTASTYLTYSFDYGNSRFIGVDVPGDADLLTAAEATFIDQRLTDAENIGLIHAFLYFHGPEYCVESIHCSCSQANDGSCTPQTIVNLINKHPIVSATFHGHEHILGWVHMSSARVSTLTHPYEEFLTSPSGSVTYNGDLFPARMDYTNLVDTRGFASVSVNGRSFTVNLYRVGTTSPVWTKTFTK
jgi:hypothetical protein